MANILRYHPPAETVVKMSYKMKKYLLITATLTAAASSLYAQDEAQTPRLETQDGVHALSLDAQESVQVFSLEDCRQMAIQESSKLEQARTQKEMAHYDVLIARANYFPNISATGGYIHNFRDISLISDSSSEALRNIGTLTQGQLNNAGAAASGQIGSAMSAKTTELMNAIMSNPAMLAEYMGSPMWQTILGALQNMDPSALQSLIPNISAPLNAIGCEIDNALHPDLSNMMFGAVTVKQPVFVGGKILYSNQMANLAEELASSKYDMEYAEIIVDIDQAYWQIISLANKKKLAESYADLLHQMQRDVDMSIAAGVSTESDALQIKVKTNEADMLLTKASNGLELSKMLLCKQMGLPLDSNISLADESLDAIPTPGLPEAKSMEQIYTDRPETRSLELAQQIYDAKAKVVRADMMPQVALVGNYLVSNPNLFNGVQGNWNGGMFSAGVMVKVPLFHGGESMNKYRKAQAEARLYTTQFEDAKKLIDLQVTQQRKVWDETMQKLNMAEANLSNAEENMRSAMVGFEAGAVDTNTVLGAQTAWLSAHSEFIDAGIELQMAAANLEKAEGNYHPIEE